MDTRKWRRVGSPSSLVLIETDSSTDMRECEREEEEKEANNIHRAY